jgi:hypothetical protein
MNHAAGAGSSTTRALKVEFLISLVAEALGNVSDDAVWRVMRKHDLHLDRRQSWCVSTDPEFSR